MAGRPRLTASRNSAKNQPSQDPGRRGMHSNVIDIWTLLRNVELEFGSPIPGGLQPDLCFREVADCTSLQTLIVVASREQDYGVTISAEDLGRAETLRGLYGVVVERIGR